MRPRDRAWLEIDLGAIVHNYHVVQQLVRAHTTVMAVVKADAYGHGAVPVSRALEAAGCGCFAVATLDEAVELREAGIGGMVLVLGCTPHECTPDIKRWRVTPSVMSVEDCAAFAGAGTDLPLPVHIKIDSGMCRMGVRYDEIAQFCDGVGDIGGLAYEGIFSHFASAATDPEFSATQIDNYTRAVAMAEQRLGPFKWQHMCASSAILLYERARFNLVRPGDLLYGMSEDLPDCELPPVRAALTLKSRLRLIKPVRAGECVGYGGTYQAADSHDIGVVTIGYADGYPRLLSNVADVLIRGRRRPLVGRVSMDTIVVDLGVEHDYQLGDEVVLLGSQGDQTIRAEELAQRGGTINQDIVARMGMRLRRVYKE